MSVRFDPRRAPGHRESLAPEFGAREAEAGGLSMAEIMAQPKLAALAASVWDELRVQFSEGEESAVQKARAADLEYRTRLANLAEVLEILLEETLDELERFDNPDTDLGRTLG